MSLSAPPLATTFASTDNVTGAWARLGQRYSRIVNTATGRTDLVVTMVPDWTGGSTVPLTGAVTVGGGLLPGPPGTFDASTGDGWTGMAATQGVLLHEAGHALVSPAHRRPGIVPGTYRDKAATLLEELRAEAAIVRRHPATVRWLRASTRQLILTGQPIPADRWAHVHAATLTIGRHAADTLTPADTDGVRDALMLNGTDLGLLDTIAVDTVAVADDDVAGMIAVADRLCDLAGVDPDSKPPRVDTSALTSDRDLTDAMQDAADAVATAAADSLADECSDLLAALGLTSGPAVAAPTGTARDRPEADGAPLQLADLARDGRGAYTSSTPAGDRQRLHGARPSGELRRQRRALAEELTRARRRERDVTTTTSTVPPGNLRTAAVVQRRAQRAAGSIPTARPWVRTRRQATEQPKLHVGIVVDTSTSMGDDVNDVAEALWLLHGAVADVRGRSASAAFGERMTPLARPGMTVPTVPTLHAVGGTEALYEATVAVAGALDLPRQQGARMLVVLSDGDWRDSARCDRLFASLQRYGVAIIHVGIGYLPTAHVADRITAINDPSLVGQHLGQTIRDVLARA